MASFGKRDAANRAARFVSRRQAVEHFERHARTRNADFARARTPIVAWSADGYKLAVGSLEGHLHVGSVESSFRVHSSFQSTNHGAAICAISAHPSQPNVFASVCGDKNAYIWDVRTTKAVQTLPLKSTALDVAWSPCGKQLVFASRDDRVGLADVATSSACPQFFQSRDVVLQALFDPRGDFVIVSTAFGRLQFLGLPDLKPLQSVQAHPAGTNLTTIACSSDGARLAVGATDALVSIWQLDNVVCERTIARTDWPLRCVAFSSDGTLLAGASEDHHIDVAWVETGERVVEIKTEAEAFGVAWHPSSPVLAYTTCSSRDRYTVRLFGIR